MALYFISDLTTSEVGSLWTALGITTWQVLPYVVVPCKV